MKALYFRFYEELNDFLPAQQRKREFVHEIARNTSIKDVIESLGVPHTEIELILVNGESVDFSYQVQHNDHISVYPMFESMDISPLLRLRDKPLRKPSFVVDSNLGKLSSYLRLLGFDCLYRNDYTDDDVAEIASQQHRIVLTRDRILLRRKIITHGSFVRAVLPQQQTREILKRFDLYRLIKPFSRCTHCNGQLSIVAKADILDQLEPLTKAHYNDFRKCDDCGQIYWPGSHYQRAMKLIKALEQ